MKKKQTIIVVILVVVFAVLLSIYVIYKLLSPFSPFPGPAPYANRNVSFTNKPDCISVMGPEALINEISFINNCKKDIVINEIESDSKYTHYEVYIHKHNVPYPGILVDLSKKYPECPSLEKPLEGDGGIIGYKCNTLMINDGASISVLGLNGRFRLSGDDNFIIEGKLE